MQVQFDPYRRVPASEIRELLRAEFQSAEEGLVDMLVVQTAVDMCRRRRLVRRKAVIDVEHGVDRHLLESPDGQRVCSVMGIRHLDPVLGDGRLMPGQYGGYDPQTRELLLDCPYPSGRYEVEVAVEPALDATEIPAELVEDCLEGLLAGVRMRLLMMPRQKWTDLQAAAVWKGEYETHLNRAGLNSLRGKQSGVIRARFLRSV